MWLSQTETAANVHNVLNPGATHDNLWLWIYQSLKCPMDMDKNVWDIVKLAVEAQTFALY